MKYVTAASESTEHLNELNRRCGWETEYMQLSPGLFEACWETRAYSDFFITKENIRTRVDVYHTPPEDKVAIIATSPGDHCSVANGQPLGSCGIQLVWPGSTTRILSFRQEIGHAVYFDAESFSNAYQQLYPEAPPLPEQGAYSYNGLPVQVQQLREAMNYCTNSAEGKYSHAERADSLRHMIFELLNNTHHQVSAEIQLSIVAQRKIAERARDYIDSFYNQPVTLTALCQHACTSSRTLQRVFIKFYDITPSCYLKVRRLNAAHKELLQLQRKKKEATVTEVAMKHGFSHLGRFSCDYKLYFHESPSTTIKRSLSP